MDLSDKAIKNALLPAAQQVKAHAIQVLANSENKRIFNNTGS